MAIQMAASHAASRILKDAIFGAAAACRTAAAVHGEENVVNATIGAVMDDAGKLAHLPTVERVLRSLPIEDYIAYAPIAGLPEYLEAAIDITFAGKKGLQIHNLKADKGKGILNLSKKLNINKSAVMAIGDSHNDLPMREATDKLIAMDNATSSLKEIADYITKSNDEDGVAHVIEKFCL